ncbi:MAG: YHS domain-containing protein, partial [Candidatus Rokuibacteriota bacterium]
EVALRARVLHGGVLVAPGGVQERWHQRMQGAQGRRLNWPITRGARYGTRPGLQDGSDPASAAAQSEYQGQTFDFCSAECKRQFDAAPERYIDATDRAEGRVHRASQHPMR